MADDIKDGAPAPTDEVVKNLKAEFTRKLSNIEDTNKALATSQAALLAQLQALAPKPAPVVEEKLSDLMYRDPEAYAQKVLQEADRRSDEKLARMTQASQKQQSVISSLVSDYPELNDGDNDLTKAAVAKFNAMADSDKNHPLAYKTAVMEAAAEAGIKPKSKRERVEGDEYTGSGSGTSTARSRTSSKGKLDPRTVEFAELVGLDISKPEVKERLANSHGRESYLKWK